MDSCHQLTVLSTLALLTLAVALGNVGEMEHRLLHLLLTGALMCKHAVAAAGRARHGTSSVTHKHTATGASSSSRPALGEQCMCMYETSRSPPEQAWVAEQQGAAPGPPCQELEGRTVGLPPADMVKCMCSSGVGDGG